MGQGTDRPLVIGHRGARGLWPENTIPGFARAIALGVDAVELDVAVTADREVVVAHDPRLNPNITRGPDGAWLEPPTPLIRELTFEQLRAYDVGRLKRGSAYAARFPDQRPQDGARIPLLREVVSLDPELPLFIEMKTFPPNPELTVAPAEMADLVVGILEAAGATPRATILSFDWRGLRRLRQHHAQVGTGWLTQRMSEAERQLWRFEDGCAGSRRPALQAVAAEGGRCWLPEFAELRQNDVAAAHRLGVEVIPWTVNRPEDIAYAIKWQVDGLISDRPDLAVKRIAYGKR
jgi:glycerophosphoryl diester phosphodiesterase